MLLAIATTPTVLVFGGNTIVGRTLELLLRSADCNVRFVSELSPDEPGLLDGVQLLLLAPGLNAGYYEVLSALIDGRSPVEDLPILELVGDDREARAGYLPVPWPCQAGDLKRRIETVLLNRIGQDNAHPTLEKGEESSVG